MGISTGSTAAFTAGFAGAAVEDHHWCGGAAWCGVSGCEARDRDRPSGTPFMLPFRYLTVIVNSCQTLSQRAWRFDSDFCDCKYSIDWWSVTISNSMPYR